MAAATTYSFGALIVQLETAVPGTYAAPCGLTSRAIKFSKSANETVIPDCADDDAAAWIERDIASLSATISGEGVVDGTAFTSYWQPWAIIATPKNCRAVLTGKGYWAGSFHLLSLDISGKRGERVAVNVELASDGACTWTTA